MTMINIPGPAQDRNDTLRSVNQAYANKKSKYGLDRETYDALAGSRQNRCWICLADFSAYPTSLCVDHDHRTDEIRGLLCTGCNLAISNMDEDPETFRRAAAYLEQRGTGLFVTGEFSYPKGPKDESVVIR